MISITSFIIYAIVWLFCGYSIGRLHATIQKNSIQDRNLRDHDDVHDLGDIWPECSKCRYANQRIARRFRKEWEIEQAEATIAKYSEEE